MFTPMEYIKIDLGNALGFDKATYKDRITRAEQFVTAVESNGLNKMLSMCHEDPYQARNAYHAIVNEDYEHVVGLDAINQALQLYGVVTGDLATASLASLGVNKRTDAYQLLANALNDSIGTTVFTRDNCKKALMITLYGSQNGTDKILEHMKVSDSMELAKQIGLTDVYEEWLTDEFNLAMKSIAPKAMEAMEVLQELNQADVGTYNWVMPDGFKVKYDVKSTQQVELKTTSRGGINFTYHGSHKVYAPSEFNRGMSPNIIHSIDGYVARCMVRRSNGTFISTIHDQFNKKAKDWTLYHKVYNEIMSDILDMDLLNNIIKQINPNARTVVQSNTLTKELIMNSSYSIS